MISMDKRYKTKDGRDVRILCVDADDSDRPVVALIYEVTGPHLKWYSLKGETGFSPNDLIEVKEKKTIKKWVNIYDDGSTYFHATEESAIRNGGACFSKTFVARVPITIEYTEGEGLSDA